MFLLLEMQLKNGTQQDYSHPTILFQRHFKHMQHVWQKEHHKKNYSQLSILLRSLMQICYTNDFKLSLVSVLHMVQIED